MKHWPKFDVVAAVKGNSREMFRDMPKQKAIRDKRRQPRRPKYPQKWED